MIDEGRVSFSVPDAVLRERVPLHAEREKEIAEFQKFIRDCRSTEQIPIYREQLNKRYKTRNYSLEIDLADLKAWQEDLASKLTTEPALFLELFEEAAKRAWNETNMSEELFVPVRDIQVQIISKDNPVPIRELQATHVSKLVRVPGIVISSSRIQAKATKLAIECRACHDVQMLAVRSGFGGAELPRFCKAQETRMNEDPNAARCPNNPYVIVPDKSIYVDQQTMKLQEAPEIIPTGEMPRNISIIIDRELVGRAVPGTRVVVTGVSQIYQSASAKSMGDASVRHPYLKVVGIQVDSDGAGRVSSEFTDAETNEFRSLARQGDIVKKIVASIAPAIFGHDDIKRVLACQLFGGCRKTLPDGMRLRGDINVLMLGDPGTAKSQLLKFVEKIAPIGVYTSGKGSSAAGLTASVVRDPSSREFYLEGGAMVLADGGIVCIDEFDKMRQQDRVAIHEAMEQQTISIAKAGITTILNARSAVAAAANPSFGVYDDLRSAEENMNEFRSTILSRFDCIFLIRDVRNEKRDKEIARHVITMHLNAASGHEEHVNTDETIDLQQLKRYIQYCRLRVFPRLTEAASELLTNHYVSVRKAYRQRERNGEGNAIPITVRQLEAIVRISESLAKMTLSPFATELHVREAIRLFTVSTVEATNSGKVMLENMSEGSRAEIEQVEALIKKKLAIESTTRVTALIATLVKSFGVQESLARRAINIMIQKDELEFRSRRQTVFRKR